MHCAYADGLGAHSVGQVDSDQRLPSWACEIKINIEPCSYLCSKVVPSTLSATGSELTVFLCCD